MPRISPAIDRANAILRAHGSSFRLREGHGSRWVSVYESRPGRRVLERSARGYVARDDQALEQLCERLLSMARQGLPLESLVAERTEAGLGLRNGGKEPCWPEICEAVVAFQRDRRDQQSIDHHPAALPRLLNALTSQQRQVIEGLYLRTPEVSRLQLRRELGLTP